jgi:cold shock protein
MAYTSTIKWFDNKKGMGFLNPVADSGNGDILVHQAEIERDFPGEFVRLHEGDTLRFQIVRTDKGYKAVRVRRV